MADARFQPDSKVPEKLRAGILAYVDAGHVPGGFLQAVISNDLRDAVARADDECLANLRDIVRWFHWEAPGLCWGSKDRLDAWLQKFARARAAEVGAQLSELGRG